MYPVQWQKYLFLTSMIPNNILGLHFPLSGLHHIGSSDILVFVRGTRDFSFSGISFLLQILQVFPCNNFIKSKFCRYILIFNTENIKILNNADPNY